MGYQRRVHGAIKKKVSIKAKNLFRQICKAKWTNPF